MERNYNIDFMKFFAIFAVVCIHTTPFKDATQLSLFINVFSRFSVPFFFMSSGYLLGQKLQVVKESFAYVKRNSFKNLKLYTYWIVLYLLYDICLNIIGAINRGVSVKLELIEYFKLFFNLKILYYGTQTSSYHLWFLVALFWSIIIVYAFVRLKKVTALLIASLVFNIIGLFGQSYSVLIELPVNTRDTLFFGLFYTTLGYYFSLNQHKLKGNANKWVYLFILASAIQIIEANFLINDLHARLGNYYFATIPLTIFLFAVVLKSTKKISKNSILVRIGSQAVGIYVIHPIFIAVVTAITAKLLRMESMTHSIVWNIVFTPFIFCISYLSYWMIQMVKGKMINLNVPKSKQISELS